jgi:hypothetical protein
MKEYHIIKEEMVGYNCILKLLPTTNLKEKQICYFQSINDAAQISYKLDKSV